MNSWLRGCFLLLSLSANCLVSNAQSFDDLYQKALERNPTVQSKYKAYESTLEKEAQAGSLEDPSLNIGYFLNSVETRVGPQRANIGLMQMLPWFGARQARRDVAVANAKISFQEYREAQNELFLKLALVYYPLNENLHRIRIEQNNIALLHDYMKVLEQKISSNKSRSTDFLRLELRLDEAKSQLHILRSQTQPLMTQINSLLNFPVDSVWSMDFQVEELVETAITEKSNDFWENPMLKKLEARSRAIEAAEIVVDKSAMPKFNLGVNYIIVEQRQDMNMPDNGKDAILPTVGISLPIYRKKYRAMRKELELQHESISLQKTALENELSVLSSQATYEVERQRELLKLNTLRVEKAEATLNLLWEEYQSGLNEFTNILEVYQQLLEFQRQEAAATAQLAISTKKLIYLKAQNL